MIETESETILNIHLAVGVFFAGSLVLGDYGNRFFVYILQVEFHHHIIAGFIEPVLTKLLPAVLVLALLEWQDVPDDYVRSHPYRLALIGGVSIGIFERVLVFLKRNAAVTPGFVLAALLHVVTALLIAGLVFSTPEEDQDGWFFGKLTGTTILAVSIHVVWNGWVAVWVAENVSWPI